MNNLEAILFDLDGVIFDPEPLSNKKRCPLLTTMMRVRASHT
jgi:beta-phosphoglucomutase-like phosphatase (HAD superfamily)